MVDPKKYYLFLDGFRAIAVFWIILHHIFNFFDLKPVLGALFIPFSKFAAVGVYGVDMFFVISGFLITGLLLEDLDNGRIGIKRFYFRRFFKIVPQYLLTVIVGVILVLTYRHTGIFGYGEYSHPLHNIWKYLLFIQNYSGNIPLLGHTWTLAVEEQFYLTYPLLLIFISALFKNAILRRKALIITCLILLILGNLYRYVQISKGAACPFQETQFHFDGLVFGILIKLVEPYIYRFAGTLRQAFFLVCFIGAMAIYLIFILIGYDIRFWPTLGLVYLAPGLLIISALIDDRRIIQYFTENRYLRRLGTSSYGIYLWHYLLLLIFIENFKQYHVLIVIAAYFVTTILIGLLSTITVERYFLNLRKTYDLSIKY